MPLESGSFDAVVSAYAIDHLGGDDIRRSLVEASRVLRPGGELLLMVMNPDGWTRVAFPLLAAHGYFGGRGAPERWHAAVVEAGFEVLEVGRAPATLYLFAKRPTEGLGHLEQPRGPHPPSHEGIASRAAAR
jgi:SAM-dependent methyltransferase